MQFLFFTNFFRTLKCIVVVRTQVLPTLPPKISGIELQVEIFRCLESSGGVPPSASEKKNHPYVRKKLFTRLRRNFMRQKAPGMATSLP